MPSSSTRISSSSAKISRAEMKEALLRSGYLLESRVATTLEQHWGYVEANPTYPDPDTGKSREFDVFAMAAHQAGPVDTDFLFAVLLVECVNNPQPLVVLTKEPQVGFLHHQEVKLSGLPVKVPSEDTRSGWQRLSKFLGMESYHHYCKGRVGTQFCSFVEKKSGRVGEWMAVHEDTHYDCFRKLCDVTDYRVDEHFKSWVFGEKEKLNIEMYYPLIVLQGDLIDARETRRSVTLRAADHLQYRRKVARHGKEATYQIDLIRERFLLKYLELIGAEINKMTRLLRRRHELVRSAIDRIVAEASTEKSPGQMRQVMDYQE